MEIKPILFSTPMVQAILDGRKTQTRRVIKPYPTGVFEQISPGLCMDRHASLNNTISIKSKYQIGDFLWVRETWQRSEYTLNGFTYKAYAHSEKTGKWKPSIFMPKEAARIFLKVTNVRKERLHDLSKDDAVKEGIEPIEVWNDKLVSDQNIFKNYLKDLRGPLSPRLSFFTLWESINGKESLGNNPWVWVYDFERIERPINI